MPMRPDHLLEKNLKAEKACAIVLIEEVFAPFVIVAANEAHELA